MQTSTKLQSLGNDFVLFDWLDLPGDEIHKNIADPKWVSFVQQTCNRKTGMGADGILIIHKNKNGIPEVLIFNSDGTNGEKCLNGLRCVAYYLFTKKNYPPRFQVSMNKQLMSCEISGANKLITINAGKANYKGKHEITISGAQFTGHIINVGNPHFVIEKKITLDWLRENGKYIEQHQDFPNRTNVEFVWHNKKESQEKNMPVFGVLVYERGCGITKACGTGAMATMQMLYETNQIQKNQKIIIKMLGGELLSFINNDNEIIQKSIGCS